MIYTTGTIAISGNTVTGTGTNFSAPLSLIRVGCTLIAIGNPVQIFTITEIKSGTELSVTPAANPAIPAGTKFSILLSDSISVDGLAQDVAETLRYYQGKETEIASAIEFFQNFDEEGLTSLVNQATSAATQTTADKAATAQYKSEAEAAKNAAQTAKADAEAAKNAAQTAASSISIPLPVSSGGTGGTNANDARNNLGLGDTSSPQFGSVSLKKTSDSTAGWVAGSVLSSVLVGASGSERVYCSIYPETKLSEPDQLTLRLKSGGVTKYAFLNINGEFIVDALKPKNAEQSRRNMNIPTLGMGEVIEVSAPPGVEDGKYYPIIVNAGYCSAYITGFNMDVITKSAVGGDPMNCCAFNGFFRMGGWSDRTDGGYGYFNRHQQSEVALHSICSSAKDNENKLFVFVEGRSFPVKFRLPVGFTITVPDGEVIYNKGSTRGNEIKVPWGVTDPLSSHKSLKVLFDFRLNRPGFYSALTEGLFYICNGGRVGMFNGITVDEEVSMTMPKLTINGIIGSSNGYVAQTEADWNGQQSDGISKFKPIAGNVNTPENSLTYGGFHVGFSGSHATQFAGRNSKFYARSFEDGVDKGWCQLATLNTANIWTADNHFSGHYVFDSTHTRFIRHIAHSTTTVNTQITTWGTSSTRLSYEVKAVDTNGAQTLLKTMFAAKYLSDGSAALEVNGNVICTSVSQSSDRDLKDNIQVISDATEAIRKMNGYTYTLKENGLPYAGVIAQEVMEALPEAVGSFTHYGEALQGPTVDGNELREETRYLNVDYAAVTGLLVQVARETDNRVTELEEENASLRANIAAMDERIAKLEELVSKLTGSEE